MERTSERILATIVAFLLAVAFVPLIPSRALAGDEGVMGSSGEPVDLAGADDASRDGAAALKAAGASQTSVAIVSELSTDSTTLDLSHANVPDGAKLYIERYASGAEIARGSGDIVFNSNGKSWFSFEADGTNTVYFGSTLTLKPGDRVVAYILGSDWSELAASVPVTVPDDGSTPALTRQDIIGACSVSMASPHADGDAAGKFVLSDTEAQVSFTLHESVEYARVVVYAYPKAATFNPDNASYNKPLFSMQVRGGEAAVDSPITATFGDKLAQLDTTYNLVAYMYYLVPDVGNMGGGGDYQYVTSQPFTVVDEAGQTTESYTFPKASIADDDLVAGSTAMHVSLSGDERLFQLAQATKDNTLSNRFAINFLVVEYDATVDFFDLDADGYGYTTLYSEEATSAFANREIELREPLTAGKKVRALCYWSQYSGDAAALPVPKGVDYAGKDNEAVIVSENGASVAASPTASITGPLTTETTDFNVNMRNLTDGQIAFVCKFGEDEQIAYSYQNCIARFTGYGDSPKPVNGANSVAVSKGALEEGDRVVAFILSSGEVVAQSEPIEVTAAPTTQAQIAITNPISSSSSKATVRITDTPTGAAVLLKSYPAGTTEFKTDKGTPHGYNANVSAGDNEFALQFTSGGLQDGYLVAFLMSAGNVVAQSEPVAVSYTAAEPEASIALDGKDVALTQGDKFISLRWSVDPTTINASYKVYQFEGDELDETTAEVVGQATLVTSKSNHSGYTWVSLGGAGGLKANAKLQLVLTADGKKAYSNVMTVAKTPDWAKVTPTITFDQNAVKADADTVKLVVNYPEEYVSELGDQFFCNVVVYQYPGTYTDEDFEDKELDEKPEIAKVVAGRNAANGATNGSIELTFSDSVSLEPGNRLVAKVRLPQAERQDHDSMWEDYLSWSIPVIAADAEEPAETVWLYNLGADTEKGAKLRGVIEGLGLSIGELSAKDLNEKVGYLLGRDGYGAAGEPFAGEAPDTEFMLMDGLSEASLDRLLAACKEAGVSVGAKGITTDTNVTWTLYKLIGDIADEHELMTTMDTLSKLAKEARAIKADDYDTSSDEWKALQDAIGAAEKALVLDEETAGGEDKLLEAYKEALGGLRSAIAAADGAKKQPMGAVLISCEKQGDGTYVLTGSIEGLSDDEADAAAFTWSDGVTGRVRTGVTVEQLSKLALSATSPKRVGSGEARLQKPSAPTNVFVSVSDSGVVSVSWNASQAGANQLPVTAYTVQLFEKKADGTKGRLVGSKRFDAQTREVSGLSAQSIGAASLEAAAEPLSLTFEGLDPKGLYMADVTAQSDLGSSTVAESAPVSDDQAKGQPGNTEDKKPASSEVPSTTNAGASDASKDSAEGDGNASEGEMEPKPAPARATSGSGSSSVSASTPHAGDSLGFAVGSLAIAAACGAALLAFMYRRMRD